MRVLITYTEADFRRALREMTERDMQMQLPDGEYKLSVETKSKQNYKSEWENAAYRATIEIELRSV